MGKDWAKDMIHVAYGMVSLESGSMSTRAGNVVLLEDVINKTIEKAYKVIEEKNPNLPDKERTRIPSLGLMSSAEVIVTDETAPSPVFFVEKVKTHGF
jgi:arginyl-tRNA synthetase